MRPVSLIGPGDASARVLFLSWTLLRNGTLAMPLPFKGLDHRGAALRVLADAGWHSPE